MNQTLWDDVTVETFVSGCTLSCIVNGFCPLENFPITSTNWFNQMTYLQGNPNGFTEKTTLNNNNINEVQLTSLNSTLNDYSGFYFSSRIQDLSSFTLQFEFCKI